MDNTHSENRESGITSGAAAPRRTIADAVARTLWELTDREYRQRLAGLCQGDDQQCGASRRRRQVSRFFAGGSADAMWKRRRSHRLQPKGMGRAKSANIQRFPEISRNLQLHSDAADQQTTSYFVSSEGSKVETPGLMAGWWSRRIRARMTAWNWCASRHLNRPSPTGCLPKRS